MKKAWPLVAFFILTTAGPFLLGGQDGLVPAFTVETDDLTIERAAQPNTYFDKVGRRFAILGYEGGQFEAWAYPLKLLRNFEWSFYVGTSTQPIRSRDIVRRITVTPAATTLTYAWQSFTIKAHIVTSLEEPGAVILFDVNSTEPLTIACGFLPVLQPMWPAGIGGQYASWDDKLKAYIISESTRKNHGFAGSPAARGISYTPAHMLSDTPNEFTIVIDKPEEVRGKFIPVVLAGGKGKREDVRNVYEHIAANPEAVYRDAHAHYRDLRRNTLRVRTPDARLNLAFSWSKISLDNLFVENPDLGRGLIAGLGTSGTGGRPGFGWFFGGDAYINSFSLNGFGAFAMVRDALAFTQKTQRQDGKMAHELSQAAGYINWFGDYPYGYLHGDTTPFYLTAVYDYFRMTGDVEFVRQSWDSLRRAYDWCLSTDEDGDGLMDNKKAGLGALEFGSLLGIQTDIYLAAVWVRAAFTMEKLAGAAGDEVMARKAAADCEKALVAFEDKFWEEETGQYSYAFNAGGERVKDLTPWVAVPMMWGLTDPDRSRRMLEKIHSAEMTTDWGVRNLSPKSELYEPLNYNYGTVWPFITGLMATAEFKQNFGLQGYHFLMANAAHVFDNAAGHVTELFSGSQNIWPGEAVAHQGFSASGVALPLVRGLLGLEGDAAAAHVIFAPQFPADWKDVAIDNYLLGPESFSLHYMRGEHSLSVDVTVRNKTPHLVTFAPSLGPGTKIREVLVNGRTQKVKTIETERYVRPEVDFVLLEKSRVDIVFEPTVEVLPPAAESKTGDSDRGLKVISVKGSRGQLQIAVEGLAGMEYTLWLTQAELVDNLEGAELVNGRLHIGLPGGKNDGFVRHDITLRIKE